MVTRIVLDHKGSPITSLDSTQDGEKNNTCWLATSHDRYVSVWISNFKEDSFQMLDWLTIHKKKQSIAVDESKKDWQQKSKFLAQFVPDFSKKGVIDTIIATDELKKELLFYNYKTKKILRILSLSELPKCLSIAQKNNLIAYGTNSRLLKLKEYNKANFQNYAEHSDAVSSVCFSNNGKNLYSVAYNEIFIWDVVV